MRAFGDPAISERDPWLCGPASRPGCHFRCTRSPAHRRPERDSRSLPV